ncbi:hypothetical protein [Saccharopolyspora sp. CA-218241]|uniref:hypothetical protein n=1 Tax=Saccharopolyspora sp. CA-218241 TaxID=3240027 RepID=UPI003D98E78D
MRARKQPVISPDDPDLAVVARSFDETEAASAALARAADWRPELPAVLRHHLVLPTAAEDAVRPVLAADGWELRAGGAASERTAADGAGFVALRVQRLDALHCSQEASRMAGLAQRHGGTALGWDALQPPAR